MPGRDPEKARARSRRYRQRKHDERYGAGVGPQNGRHGNHARGENNARWSGARRVTSEGYVAVRVPANHPHAWGPPSLRRFKYAYEHHVVMMERIGRPLRPDEIVHHVNGDRTDNRSENLALETRSEHAREHGNAVGARDRLGRFAAGERRIRHPKGGDPSEWPVDLRVREFPEVTP